MSRIKEVEELEKIFDKEDFDCFFELKKVILYDLFFANQLKDIYGIFSEIYPQIINQQKAYNFKIPKQYFFVMGIKGWPILSYYLYSLNIFAISILQRLKKLFG